MPDLWMPGATRLDIGDHQPTDGGPAKAIAHITWDKNATAAKPVDLVPYTNLRSYFAGGGAGVAPHILWDPFEGHFTQFVPANSRSKSLVDQAGGTRTNRAGKRRDPDRGTVLPVLPGRDPRCTPNCPTPPARAGSNCRTGCTPGASPTPGPWAARRLHPAPQRVRVGDEGRLVRAQPGPGEHPPGPGKLAGVRQRHPGQAAATYEPFPGASFFTTGRRSPIIAAMHKRLVEVGCNRYQSTSNADVWGSGDERSYAAWQRHLGYTGSAADGTPGPTSWAKLHVPNV
jgi:hypothetical protein